MNPNEETLAFYYSIGLAVTQWAHVEIALARIALSCLETKKREAAANAFFAIENFRSKLSYVDALVSGRNLSPDYQSEWINLRERAEKHAKKRNMLVHRWALTDPDAKPGHRRQLLRFRPNKKFPAARQPDALRIRDIQSFRLEFVALMRALENFECRLDGRKPQFEKSLELSKRPPTIPQIRREIRGYISPPQ